MTGRDEIIEVAVYAEDGRDSLLGTLHGWRQSEKGWSADVMVYGPQGQYRDVVPSHRVLRLEYCGRVPGEIRHRCDREQARSAELRVWR